MEGILREPNSRQRSSFCERVDIKPSGDIQGVVDQYAPGTTFTFHGHVARLESLSLKPGDQILDAAGNLLMEKR
jgi:hypothetical protein